jgi:hypothetical protein
MSDGNSSVGELLSQTTKLLRDNSRGTLIAFAAIAAIGCLTDWLSRVGNSPAIISTIVSIYFQYESTNRVLGTLGLLPEESPKQRFGAVFGLGILTGLGMIAGLLLLIVPGIILAVRWSVAVPALLSEGIGITAALGRSWEETKGRFWTIFFVMLIIYLPMTLALGSFAIEDPATNFGIATIIANLIIAGCSVAGWHAAIAIYTDRRSKPTLAEVFA